ncbi:RecT family recombinase [Aliamphritea hakodatensis]|uniref:RecT family recombinase n=1 Tax=Aliamphritea hakodatensis TaxID=2895352 RepID=UPI0022FD8D8C|nr:RecT family recombinase [Aliamphritea hakodatensis]
MTQQSTHYQPPAVLSNLAQRLNIDAGEMHGIVMNTLIKAKGNNGNQVSNEEFVTFLAIANEYKLNPLTKEIYAFANRGAIQPIVSIDGWLKIINGHPQFDGMEFEDSLDDKGKLSAITCRIFRKDRTRHTEVTEYFNECAGTSDPWKKWPARMLRHKATIQAARYAFGLSGIVDPDEAERIESVQPKDVSPSASEPEAMPFYSADDFEKNFPTWKSAIESEKRTPDQIIAMVSSKAQLTDEQQQQIKQVAA